MTTLNLNWVKENFNKENLVVFDIGAGDMEVSKMIRKMIPTAKLYAFEAFDFWHEGNEESSLKYNINDFHIKFHEQIYGDPVTIDSLRLETFCKEHNVIPDFIHIDVEGAELKVFQNIGKYKPNCIWAEVGGFNCYDSNTSYEEFNQLMTDMGYYMVYGPPNVADALYCLTDFKITPYIPITQ